jgi:S-adenosylmethionine hydrolase
MIRTKWNIIYFDPFGNAAPNLKRSSCRKEKKQKGKTLHILDIFFEFSHNNSRFNVITKTRFCGGEKCEFLREEETKTLLKGDPP